MKKTLASFALGSVLVMGVVSVSEAAPNQKARERGVQRAQVSAVVSSRAQASRSVRPARGVPVRTSQKRAFVPQRVAVVQRPVAAAPMPAVMNRPVFIGDANINPDQGAGSGGRKPLPQRMYASYGDMFYYNGRQYRVEGVAPVMAKQEVVKQRLQQMLDSGDVSIEPKSLDEASGLTTAVIRVAGRDVAESLK
jgi:hypothetical protein